MKKSIANTVTKYAVGIYTMPLIILCGVVNGVYEGVTFTVNHGKDLFNTIEEALSEANDEESE